MDTANEYSYYSRIASIAEDTVARNLNQGAWGMVRATARFTDYSTARGMECKAGSIQGCADGVDRGLQVSNDAHLLVLKGDLLMREGAEDEAVTAYEKAMSDPAWERVAQQRIWKIHPPETEEEKLKREFFGGQDDES